MALATLLPASVPAIDCSAGLEPGRYIGTCKFFDAHSLDLREWFGYIIRDSIKDIQGEYMGGYVDDVQHDLRFIYESLHPDITLREIRDLTQVRVSFEVRDFTDRNGTVHRVISNVRPA